MKQEKIDIQTRFLVAARKDKVPVTIFLVNGFQINGVIKGYDAYTIEVEAQGKQQLIFKHAVSTIAPNQSIKLQK